MKKYLTLAAITAALGITWAVAAPPATGNTEAAQAHQHGSGHVRMQGMHEMTGKRGMQGMMGQHHGGMHAQAKDGKHNHELMACNTSAHGVGKHQHQHEAPAK